ncbi:MAG: hypothetical protein V2A72_03840 [Candidatus Omnitrophota bacterium]
MRSVKQIAIKSLPAGRQGGKNMACNTKEHNKIDMKKVETDIKEFWEHTKDYLKKAADESSVLIKKGEEHVKSFSEKSKLTLEAMILKTKQERLYTELGKLVAKTGSISRAKVDSLRKQIRGLGAQIAAKTKKAKSV